SPGCPWRCVVRGELVVRDILRQALPDVEVTNEVLPPRSISGSPFVFVSGAGGSATHPTKVEQPVVSVVIYGRGDVGRLEDEVTTVLLSACETGTATDHRYVCQLTILTLLCEQAIAGIPAGVRRYFALYGISIRPPL